jgi:hypothetical protein
MGKRTTLTLKPKGTPEADPMAELLDQGSDLDPHNLHKLVQPSRAPAVDLERLKAIIDRLGMSATGDRSMKPRTADALKMEASSLIAKIGNAASGNAIDRD